MARPPRQDGEEFRRQVLALARRDVLAAGGVQGLSLRAIARELGYSPGSLYRYFDGRDAVLRALAEQASAQMNAAVSRAANLASEPEPLVAIGMAYVDTCLQHPEDQLLAGILRSRTSPFQPVPAHSPYRIVVAAFRRAVARGQLPPTSPERLEQMAYGLWAFAHGIVGLRLTHLRAFDADFPTIDRENLRALLRGYAAGQPEEHAAP